MKLRNKKTGKPVILRNKISGKIVKDYSILVNDDFSISLIINGYNLRYYSRKQFMNEWEDANEEPKDIQNVFNVGGFVCIEMNSEEEAEKAVEKLKAWTRLRNKGFKFDRYYQTDEFGDLVIETNVYEYKVIEDMKKDLDLLFGGEDA